MIHRFLSSLFLFYTFQLIHGFTVPNKFPTTSVGLNMIPDGNIMNQIMSMGPIPIAAAASLVGTAVGWSARSAEVSNLQNQNQETKKELKETKETLATVQKDLDAKVETYEKALFEMDLEFEGQTSIIKAEYAAKLEESRMELEDEYNSKLSKAKAVLQEESELKLFEQEGRMKQEFLQGKLAFEASFNQKSTEDIIKGLERQSQLITENKELRESLEQIQGELKDIVKMRKNFFS